MATRKPAIGGGEKFAKLAKKLQSKGASNPAALAAVIGRKKYGKARFDALAASGRRNRKVTAPPRQEARTRV